jgi:hypothetical protein
LFDANGGFEVTVAVAHTGALLLAVVNPRSFHKVIDV